MDDIFYLLQKSTSNLFRSMCERRQKERKEGKREKKEGKGTKRERERKRRDERGKRVILSVSVRAFSTKSAGTACAIVNHINAILAR